MAVTLTPTSRTIPGSDTLMSNNVTPDNNYTTGGYEISQMLGLTVVRRFLGVRANNVASAKYIPVLTNTFGPSGAVSSSKLAFVVASTGLEVAAGTDLSATSYHVLAEGN